MKKEDNFDSYVFHEGTNYRAYSYFGQHPAVDSEGKPCTVFRVWAPHARSVSVLGDFNGWSLDQAVWLEKIEEGGIYEGYVYGLKTYDTYKYRVEGSDGRVVLKSDPFGFHMETRPATGSKIYDLSGYEWHDAKWLKKREETIPYRSPMNIYEVHLGSWKMRDNGDFYDYVSIAQELVKYVKKMVEKGLLEKYRASDNKKNVILRVSELGRTEYETYSRHAKGTWFEGLFERLDALTSQELKSFQELIELWGSWHMAMIDPEDPVELERIE